MIFSDPQIIFSALVILVPIFIITSGDDRAMLAWICFTAGMNIFDASMVIHLPAARIAGLLVLPKTLENLHLILRSKIGRAVIAGYLYLVLTGVFFGFLFPWGNDGLIREFNQLPAGRTIIYLIRSTADLSIVFFVALNVAKKVSPLVICNYMLIAITASSLFGIIEFVTSVNFYTLITGLAPDYGGLRVRGLCYEPRGLALVATYAIAFSLVFLYLKRTVWTIMLLIINVCSFLLTNSTSGLIAMFMAFCTLVLTNKRGRVLFIKMFAVALLLIGFFFSYQLLFTAEYTENIFSRLSGERYGKPENFIQYIAFKTEVFDCPAILFLADNPEYLLSGTGPGLIPIPSTPYLPAIGTAHYLETGINSTPTMGILLEISNSGVIGLLVLCIVCLCSFRAFNAVARYHPDKRAEWLGTRAIFTAGAAIYIAQNSALSPIWSILIGIGLGADLLFLTDKSGHKCIRYETSRH